MAGRVNGLRNSKGGNKVGRKAHLESLDYPRLLDITGQTFGRLTAESITGTNSWGNVRWMCSCSCGRQVVVTSGNLHRGNTKSCGCLRTHNLIHGATRNAKPTPEYRAWIHMIGRCENLNDISYKNYGGRGISIDPEWRVNYMKFLYDMGDRPSEKHSLDRINNEGDYEKENCRWATTKEQAKNRRKPRLSRGFKRKPSQDYPPRNRPR